GRWVGRGRGDRPRSDRRPRHRGAGSPDRAGVTGAPGPGRRRPERVRGSNRRSPRPAIGGGDDPARGRARTTRGEHARGRHAGSPDPSPDRSSARGRSPPTSRRTWRRHSLASHATVATTEPVRTLLPPVTDFRPTVCTIDLAALRHNVRALAPPRAQMMAVVKANGYGHGAEPVARAALAAGATSLGV